MKYLHRIVDMTWRLLTPGGEEVALVHVPSGQLLASGSERVRFPSTAAAAEFRSRYLDEAPAWETIPVEQIEQIVPRAA